MLSERWVTLPDKLKIRILEALPPNDVACNVRLLSKGFQRLFRAARHKTVRLSQSVPPSAFQHEWKQGSSSWPRLTYQKRLQLLCLTAATGVLENLQTAVKGAGCILTAKVLEAAAKAGYLHICIWIRQRGCPWGGCFASAAQAGQRLVCEWLLENGCKLDRHAVEAAARGGHVDLMEWLLRLLPEGQPLIPRYLVAAVAEGCDLPTLQRYHISMPCGSTEQRHLISAIQEETRAQQREQRAPEPQQLLQRLATQDPDHMHTQLLMSPQASPTPLYLTSAARSPTPDWQAKVVFLASPNNSNTCYDPPGSRSISCPGSSDARTANATVINGGAAAAWAPTAAAAGCPDAIKRLTWLRGQGYTPNQRAVESAAWRGHVVVLAYLLGPAGVRVTSTRAAQYAAAGGRLAVLQALAAAGCPVDSREAVVAAVRGGHLDMAEWLVGTFNVEVAQLPTCLVDDAARAGSIRLMAWLRRRGCRLGAGTLTAAALGGCEEALEWLAENGCSTEVRFEKPYGWAAFNQDHSTLRCLRRLGCPMVGPGHPYYAAAKHGDLETLRFLQRDLGYPFSPSAATFADWAGRGVPLASLRWLLEEGGCQPTLLQSVRALRGLPLAVQQWLKERQRQLAEEEEEEARLRRVLEQRRLLWDLMGVMVGAPLMPSLFGMGIRVVTGGGFPMEGAVAYTLSAVGLVTWMGLALPRPPASQLPME